MAHSQRYGDLSKQVLLYHFHLYSNIIVELKYCLSVYIWAPSMKICHIRKCGWENTECYSISSPRLFINMIKVIRKFYNTVTWASLSWAMRSHILRFPSRKSLTSVLCMASNSWTPDQEKQVQNEGVCKLAIFRRLSQSVSTYWGLHVN